MRRPALHACGAALALLTVATPARAQRERILRRAFEPAITPFVGATGFGTRTTGASDGAEYDFTNGIALGVQADKPLTRRTAFVATLAITPVTRVNASNSTTVLELDRTVVAGLDVGIAARLKPAAPLFAYAGGGATMSPRRAAGETSGFGADPRLTAGLGLDLMRFERTGVRIAWFGHYVFPTTPDDVAYPAESSAFDFTLVLGGRYTLGFGRSAEGR